MADAKEVVERLARAIYRKRPDCAGKPWPLETEDQKRAYPHNPIAAVELSFDYAKAALQELSAMGLVVVPREPTEAMLDAATKAPGDGNLETDARLTYTAMLTASKVQP